MFTGLIQKTGSLAHLRPRGKGVEIIVRHDPWDDPLTVGESIAVHGVCLTVTRGETGWFSADVLRETLDRTNLGSKRPGTVLNLERALKMNDRLGGHFVTGHVDGVGIVRSFTRENDDYVLEIGAGPQLLANVILKGAVACDGISLTVAEMSAVSFHIHIIPATCKKTSFGTLKRGDTVNVETDTIGKYVRKYLSQRQQESGITIDNLRNAGFQALPK